MSCSELAVCVDEDLDHQDLVQTYSVYKVEVGRSSVWEYKVINKDKRIIHEQSANQRKYLGKRELRKKRRV